MRKESERATAEGVVEMEKVRYSKASAGGEGSAAPEVVTLVSRGVPSNQPLLLAGSIWQRDRKEPDVHGFPHYVSTSGQTELHLFKGSRGWQIAPDVDAGVAYAVAPGVPAAHPGTVRQGEWQLPSQPSGVWAPNPDFHLRVEGPNSENEPYRLDEIGADFFLRIKTTKLVWFIDPTTGEVTHSGAKASGSKGKPGKRYCPMCNACFSANNFVSQHLKNLHTPPAPTAPEVLPDGEGGVVLTWTADGCPPGAQPCSYTVQYSEDGGATWEIAVASTGSPEPRARISHLRVGPTYHFRVSAIALAHTGPYSAASAPFGVSAVDSAALAYVPTATATQTKFEPPQFAPPLSPPLSPPMPSSPRDQPETNAPLVSARHAQVAKRSRDEMAHSRADGHAQPVGAPDAAASGAAPPVLRAMPSATGGGAGGELSGGGGSIEFDLEEFMNEALAEDSGGASKRARPASAVDPRPPLSVPPPLGAQTSTDKLFMDLHALFDPEPLDADGPVWRAIPGGSTLSDLAAEATSPTEQSAQLQKRSSLARAPGASSAYAGRAAAREKEKKDHERLVQLRAALMAASAADKARLLTAERLVAVGRRGSEREVRLLLTHAPPEAVSQACARDQSLVRSVRGAVVGGRGGMLCAGSLTRLPAVTDVTRPALAAVLDDAKKGGLARSSGRRLGLVASLAAIVVAVGIVCGVGGASSPPPPPTCVWAWGKGCVPANGATRGCKFVPFRPLSPCIAASLT